MTSKNIESASRALSAIDVRSHVAAISEATAAQQRFANAVEDGRQRITALNIEIREALNQEVTDPASAGDALLAGVEPDAVDVEKLRATKRSIEAGMTDLRNRRTELSDTIRRERGEAVSALAAVSSPLLDEAREMARQAAAMLAQAHAVAEATRLATSSGGAAHMADQLAEYVRALHSDGYFSAAPVEVPSDVVNALSAAKDQISAMKLSIATEVMTFAPRLSPARPDNRPPAGPSKSPDRVPWLS